MSAAPDSPREVVVLDLGVGNLGNLARALAHVGGQPRLTADPEVVAGARCLVLAGVGAFRPPREVLRGRLETALRQALGEGASLLGICVGFQLLFERSEEFGSADGLALLAGQVTRLPDTVPLPHIGWNRLHDFSPHPLLAGLAEGTAMYFVHSFAPEGLDPASVLVSATHGRHFAAVAGRGRVVGTQFHPEKSGRAGLALLRNFLEFAHGSAAGD